MAMTMVECSFWTSTNLDVKQASIEEFSQKSHRKSLSNHDRVSGHPSGQFANSPICKNHRDTTTRVICNINDRCERQGGREARNMSADRFLGRNIHIFRIFAHKFGLQITIWPLYRLLLEIRSLWCTRWNI